MPELISKSAHLQVNKKSVQIELAENYEATRIIPLVVVLGTKCTIWFWGRNSKFCFGHYLRNDFLKVHKKFGVNSYKNKNKVIKRFKYYSIEHSWTIHSPFYLCTNLIVLRKWVCLTTNYHQTSPIWNNRSRRRRNLNNRSTYISLKSRQ